MRNSKVVLKFISVLTITLALLFALLPLYWLLTISLKTEVDQFANPPLWFSFTPTLEHFRSAFGQKGFGQYMINSVLVAVTSTIISLIIGIPAAYSLTKLKWSKKQSEKISFWILSNRFLPPIVTIVPLFLMLRSAELLDTPWALIIVYVGFNLPFVIWMMQSFFREIPTELEEAARMDGDSYLGALIHIMLPVAAPGIAATAIFSLIVAWNEFIFALVLTQTEAAMTLPIGIASQVTQYEIRWGVMSAAGTAAMLPVFLFSLFVQKYLVRGLSMGAVKG